jgi:EAL domain-containing protein (putative c-di-GMP-specific phosphodiesterase class I)
MFVQFFLIYTFLSFAFLLDYLTRKHLPIKRTKLFRLALVTQILTVYLNMITQYANSGGLILSPTGLLLLSSVFVASYLLRSYVFYLYEIEAMNSNHIREWARNVGHLVFIFGVILILVNLKTGIIFYFDKGGFHEGSYGKVFLWITIIYMTLGLIALPTTKRSLTKYKSIFLVWTNLLLICSSVLRMFVEKNVAMGAFGFCAIAFLYMAFEDPYQYLHRGSTAFNETALNEVLQEWNTGTKLSVLAIRISHYRTKIEIYGKTTIEELIIKICDEATSYLKNIPVFYHDGTLFILSDHALDFETINNYFKEILSSGLKAGKQKIRLNINYKYANFGKEDRLTELVHDIKIILEDMDNETEKRNTSGELSKQERSRISLNKRINKLLDGNLDSTVLLYLQPIVEARTRKLIGAEALMRLRDTDGTILFPDQFIPIAEKNGTIHSIGKQIYKEACEFLNAHNMGADFQWMNVNLSPLQCLDKQLPEKFAEIASSLVKPEMIHLEITEESMAQRTELRVLMDDMNARGFRFAMDDYGSGYANASRLKELPFSNVKIDKGVVWNYFHEPDAVLPLTVQMLHGIGCTVTAEGVETEEMVDALEKMGVDYLQGYYFSKPIPADEFVKKYEADRACT